jgi:hypothetical protein
MRGTIHFVVRICMPPFLVQNKYGYRAVITIAEYVAISGPGLAEGPPLAVACQLVLPLTVVSIYDYAPGVQG